MGERGCGWKKKWRLFRWKSVKMDNRWRTFSNNEKKNTWFAHNSAAKKKGEEISRLVWWKRGTRGTYWGEAIDIRQTFDEELPIVFEENMVNSLKTLCPTRKMCFISKEAVLWAVVFKRRRWQKTEERYGRWKGKRKTSCRKRNAGRIRVTT